MLGIVLLECMSSRRRRVCSSGTLYSLFIKVRFYAELLSVAFSSSVMIGYYADAILKFNLTFPPNYPERPPTVQFVTDIFHPLISQDGTFGLSPRFRPWR